MPSVCCLTRKSDGKHTNGGGVTFQEIDAELCKHFQVPCDNTNWYNGWYDHHCFLIALGKTLPEIIKADKEVIVEYQAKPASDNVIKTIEHYQRQVAIGEYLLANYATDSWREFKRNKA